MQTVREWLVVVHPDNDVHPSLLETGSPQKLRDTVARRPRRDVINMLHEGFAYDANLV